MNLTLGMIGLGRMGGNMSRRLARAGHTVVAWDRSPDAGKALHDEPRVATADTLEALVSRLPAPKVVWLMLPAGAPTDETLQRLVPLLSPGDVVVDPVAHAGVRRLFALAPGAAELVAEARLASDPGYRFQRWRFR